jgi:hypothetical protein
VFNYLAVCCEDTWGIGGIARPFLTSELGEGEWSALPPGERGPGAQCIGGWVDPRAGLDVVDALVHAGN